MVRVVRVSMEEGMSLPRELLERSWVDSVERPLAARQGETLWPGGRRGRGRPRKKCPPTAVEPAENPDVAGSPVPEGDLRKTGATDTAGSPTDAIVLPVKSAVVDPLDADRAPDNHRMSAEDPPPRPNG